MCAATTSDRNWPRRRLLIRSIISATMPIGWTWAAITALIPYFWLGHGPGTSTELVLGATRATWMSLHVWSSIAMGILTIAHMVLNRKGVARSYRIVGDVPNKAATARPTKRGFAWAGVVLLLTISIVGGYWFAAIDDTHGSGNERQVATAQSSADNVSIRGGGNGNRGR